MGAVPKRKISSGRRDRRRSHHAVSLPQLVQCPQCKALKLPHHACPNCGLYHGRTVIQLKEDKKKK